MTADHEMPVGDVTLAPAAGEIKLGAGGVAAMATFERVKRKHSDSKKLKVDERRFFMVSPCSSRTTDHRHGRNDQPESRVVIAKSGSSSFESPNFANTVETRGGL